MIIFSRKLHKVFWPDADKDPAFSRVGVKIWKKIPNEFKTLSKDSFNKKMKTTLFQILDSEDSYLDVENISSKLEDCLIKTN